MKVYSLIRDSMGLRKVEVEVAMMVGLPKIQFLGLPDTLIKESVFRIQSAFKNSGFKMPKNRQIVVNLKPAYLKKNSKGLDLAIASAILWESEQVPKPAVDSILLYGELSLKGDVLVPDDFRDITKPLDVDRFYTGKNMRQPFFDLYGLSHLSTLSQPEFVSGSYDGVDIRRPKIPKIQVSQEQAKLIQIISVGEHPTLLAGPPGTGKTTLAQATACLLQDPTPSDFLEYQKISRYFGRPISWRPIVNPHHSATPLSMIGGGQSPRPGDITRAHGGALILDEFLEFDPKVSEALREPLEAGRMTVSRLGHVMTFPARILLLATTNLCPCGHYIPERDFECRGRPRTCFSSIQKLSGPMLDRFHLLSFSHEWDIKNQTIPLEEVYIQIQKIWEFQKEQGRKEFNRDLNVEALDLQRVQDLMPSLPGSLRRKNAFLKVLRTVADCDLSPYIEAHHLEKAYQLTIQNMARLKNLG